MVKQKRAPLNAQRKRHGKHQKKTQPFIKVYWPYLPLMVIVLAGLLLSFNIVPPGKRGVLAYATDVSTAGLIESTNQRRRENGRSVLSINTRLNQAAQAKANDMAARNYWSHNTPEGEEPWIFIDAAGYAYKQAGENLAYGFTNSSDTVNGWMNSPSHRANLLDASYLEVGFGFANSGDYQDSGPQTVIVAMYGNPQVAAASTPAAPSQAAKQPAAAPVTEAPAPPPAADTAAVNPAPEPEVSQQAPVNSLQPNTDEPAAQKVARVQALTGGNAPWSIFAIGLLSGISIAYLVLKHGLRLRRMVVHGERFILHHTLLDVTIIALIALCSILSSSVGVIR